MEPKPYRILFLEDEPTIREVLTEYMKISGYAVTEAARGDEALSWLQEKTMPTVFRLPLFLAEKRIYSYRHIIMHEMLYQSGSP